MEIFHLNDKSRNKLQDTKFKSQSKVLRSNPSTSSGASFGTISTKTEKETNSKPAHQDAGKKLWRCLLCSSQHNLNDCADFKKKPYPARVDFVKEKGLCFNCLVPRHMVKTCKKRPACSVCDRKHDTLLHSPLYDRTTLYDVPINQGDVSISTPCGDSVKQESGQETTNKVNGYIGVQNAPLKYKIGLPILPVKVKAKGGDTVVVTLAFIDNGSNTTFCTEELMNQVRAVGKKTRLHLTTLDSERNPVDANLLDLEVYDLEENVLNNLPTVFTRPKLPVTEKDAAKQDDVDRWPHLSGVIIPDVKASVGLLIGNDNSDITEPLEIRKGYQGTPYAVRTVLGWVLNGPLGLERATDNHKCTASFVHSDEDLNLQFSDFCNREFSDCITDKSIEMSQEDKRALNIMENSVKLVNGHYEIALPFRTYPPNLPNNKSVALHRLFLLKKKFQKDPIMHGKYSKFMEDLVERNFAERVPESCVENQDGLVWYLPHHSVVHPQKPDKVRVVFDCSAKYEGASLNNNLLLGPDLTNTLVGVLLRFRLYKVAMMSDIESMFHQVRVKPDHCDFLRFLWWPNGDTEGTFEEYRMRVHLFGATSSPSCSNFALRQTAKDHVGNFEADVISTVQSNFYVDDCLKSVDNEEEAIDLAKQLMELLKLGGFRLTKWVSNSRKVIASIPENERASAVKNLDLPVGRALGMQWNVDTDQFEFRTSIKNRPATRRGILSVASSTYDPLGFVSPFVLPAKVLLQDLCRLQLGWDDEIPKEYLSKWLYWLEQLPKLKEYKLNRCIKPVQFGEVECQLHHFSDASENGYGVASYLREVNNDGEVFCTLVMAKSRVAPLKQVTIPRLELSAAVLATKVDHLIRIEQNVPKESMFWTDSTAVLKYIHNEDKGFHTFTANRIAKIRDSTQPRQWHYIDSKSNPADDASRGLSADAFLRNERWLQGPEFLWNDEQFWPLEPEFKGTITLSDPEVKQSKTCYFSQIRYYK